MVCALMPSEVSAIDFAVHATCDRGQEDTNQKNRTMNGEDEDDGNMHKRNENLRAGAGVARRKVHQEDSLGTKRTKVKMRRAKKRWRTIFTNM